MTEAVYVLEPGAYLRKEGASLRVVKDSAVIDHIPAEGLKRLLLIGYVSLSGPVLDFLIRNRIETVFMTPSGRFRARLALDEHRHVELRRAQYLSLEKVDVSLTASRRIVAGKIENMKRFVQLRSRQYGSDSLRTAALQLKAIGDRTDASPSIDVVRGMEGAAARIYYGVFQELIRRDSFRFQGRNRRPPRDPVNAMLSFVYTLLTNEVLSAVKACGLDPYLGALHEVSYGRPSLACDLVEEYRVFLGDRFVLGIINRGLVTETDFIVRRQAPKTFVDEEEMKAKRPVEMKPAISRTFIAAYEKMMAGIVYYEPRDQKVSYRQLIHQQARRFAEYMQDSENGYRPFVWEV